MGIDHLFDVHPVDVVRAKHDDVVRVGVTDQVERLIDGVCGPLVPAGSQALLSGDGRHVGTHQGGEPPRHGDMPVQGMGFVLGQYRDLGQPRVREIGQDEVDQPVAAPERHRRFGAIGGQRHQPLPLATSEDD